MNLNKTVLKRSAAFPDPSSANRTIKEYSPAIVHETENAMKTVAAYPVIRKTAKPNSRVSIWLKRVALGLVIGIVALIVTGAVYQLILINWRLICGFTAQEHT